MCCGPTNGGCVRKSWGRDEERVDMDFLLALLTYSFGD